MRQIICVFHCFSWYLHAFDQYCFRNCCLGRLWYGDVQNYCRWSITGEGNVLWTFVHFPCWDTVYKKLWLALIGSPVLKNSSYRADTRDFFSVWGWVYIGFFLGIWLNMCNQIFEFIQIYCIMLLCWHSHTETSKNFFNPLFFFCWNIQQNCCFLSFGILFPCKFSLTTLRSINGECSYSCFIHSIILTAYYSL